MGKKPIISLTANDTNPQNYLWAKYLWKRRSTRYWIFFYLLISTLLMLIFGHSILSIIYFILFSETNRTPHISSLLFCISNLEYNTHLIILF